jgi:hypothetical protein
MRATQATKDAPERNASSIDLTQQLEELRAENARLKAELEPLRRAGAFFTQYAPEIEERRAHYARLAEALALFADLEGDCEPALLDLASDVAGEGQCLANARDLHLRALCLEQLDWMDPRTILKFYAEMRLWADHLVYERQQERSRVA